MARRFDTARLIAITGLVFAASCQRGEVLQPPRESAALRTDGHDDRRPPMEHGPPPGQYFGDWRVALDDLGAPPAVLAWAESQEPDFQRAWSACTDPLARIWLARAGGASQREIVAGIAQVISRASRTTELPPAAKTQVGSALAVLLRFVQGKADDAERERAASELFNARTDWVDTAGDLAFATEHALRAAKDVSTMETPHDFMWLSDAHGALKVLVRGFKTKGLVAPAEANDLLRATLHPSGSALDPSIQLSLSTIESLTDEQLLGRVYVRAVTTGDRASPVERVVASTITLENEVQNGGFGQFFTNWSEETAAAAQDAYQRIDRSDLAILVGEARGKAKGMERSALLGHPAFEELNSRFWKALKKDPAAARAAYVRRALKEP